jgi:transcriptional regulator with PAS, ATPase and Fis domain
MPRHIEPDEALIRAALAEAGSVKGAAEQIGISRRTLQRWMDRLGIKVGRQLVVEEAA